MRECRMNTQRVKDEAADWLYVLKHEPTAERSAAFEEWLSASPRHAEEFRLAQELNDRLQRYWRIYPPGCASTARASEGRATTYQASPPSGPPYRTMCAGVGRDYLCSSRPVVTCAWRRTPSTSYLGNSIPLLDRPLIMHSLSPVASDNEFFGAFSLADQLWCSSDHRVSAMSSADPGQQLR